MAIKAVCPECRTVYQLADQQAGKKVRCKSCQEVFVVEAASQRAAVAKPSTMIMRRRGEEDEENVPGRGPAKNVEKKSALPWVLGGVAVVFGVLLLVCGSVITYLVMVPDNKPAPVAHVNPAPPPPPVMAPQAQPPMQPSNQPNNPPPAQADSQPVQPQPVQSAKPALSKTAETPSDAPSNGEVKKEDKEENSGRLTEERRKRVTRATVYLRVKLPDGTGATGSGFFGCKEAPSIILTNAHVVGMLSPDSPRPLEVEVIVNSGEANEWSTKARVLGVDRHTDLAVLDIGSAPQPLPEPLVVKEAGKLNQLDSVYVFGFPYGEQLGKEITIRPASVSALRKNPKTGLLDRIQVNGGMDPGNSGGPVVDNSGAVVGVAVAVWASSRQINFAIPGERVHAILSGRIADLTVQQPFFTEANKVVVPIALGTIDPRNLIKEVGLELWTGDKPADTKSGNRPESSKQPAANAGDSPHVYYNLKYLAPEGRAQIELPALPPGKVYWAQPRWVNAQGKTHWEMAKPLPELPQPVYRKPAKLELRFSQGAKRSLDLTHEMIFRVSENDDANSIRIRTIAQLAETVASTGASGTQLNLRYRYAPTHEIILPDGQSIADSDLEQIKDEFPRLLFSSMLLNHLGTITKQAVDARPLLQLRQTNPKQAQLMMSFHKTIQQGMEGLSVSLPASGQVNPLESWKAERPLPIATPSKTETGKLDVTFTYQGTRKRDGREEAVITLDGLMRGKDNSVGGRASGQILVDVASGQTILAEASVKFQLRAMLNKPGEEPRELRVMATMVFRMVRKRMV
jgi:predicted Zn finger-like uncharacterized protein